MLTSELVKRYGQPTSINLHNFMAFAYTSKEAAVAFEKANLDYGHVVVARFEHEGQVAQLIRLSDEMLGITNRKETE